MKTLLSLVAALLLALPATAQEGSFTLPPAAGTEASPEELLASATTRFGRAVEMLKRDRVVASSLFREAGAAYTAIYDAGIENHRLLLNAGNAWMLAGDVGHAVLAYKRAERLRPHDEQVQRSLAFARSRVGIDIRPSRTQRLIAFVTSWRGVIPRAWLTWAVLGGYVVLWVMATLRLTRHRGLSRPKLAVALGVLVLLGVGLIAIEQRLRVAEGEAVVVAAAGVTARNGPNEGVYDPAFDQPLPPGVEVRLLESREGWQKIRLLDGREAWVPRRTLEPI